MINIKEKYNEEAALLKTINIIFHQKKNLPLKNAG